MITDELSAESILASGQARSVEIHAELGSTQDRARELAADAATKLPALVVAERQSSGRGRGEHLWHTAVGSLAFSLLLDESSIQSGPRDSSRLSLAVTTALVRVVQTYLPTRRVGLHWPNDVFVGDRKLAGVLIERLATGRLLIGVGLNVNNRLADAPPELHSKLTTLADLLGAASDRNEILIAVVAAINHQLHQLSHTAGNRFDEFCLQRGATLTVQVGDEQISGVCLGISDDGGLRIETPSGERILHTGSLIQ